MGMNERLAVGHMIEQENGKASRPSQGRFPLVRALLSAGLIAGLIYMIDLDKIWASFQTMHLLPFLAACFIFAVTQILTARRWQMVLRSLRNDAPGLWFVNGLSMIGLFFNFFLPSTVGGDVVRAEMAKTSAGGRAASYTSVLFDRFSAFIAVVLIGMVAMVFSYAGIGWFDWQIALFSLVFLAITLSVFAALATSFADRVLNLLDRGPLKKLVALARNPLMLLQDCAANRGLLLRITGMAIVIHLLTVLVVYCLALALHIHVGLLFHFVAIPIIILATLVPISLNGFGVREVAFVLLYAKVGVESEAAVALSFSWVIVLLLFGLLGGLLLQFPILYRFVEDRAARAAQSPTPGTAASGLEPAPRSKPLL